MTKNSKIVLIITQEPIQTKKKNQKVKTLPMKKTQVLLITLKEETQETGMNLSRKKRGKEEKLSNSSRKITNSPLWDISPTYSLLFQILSEQLVLLTLTSGEQLKCSNPPFCKKETRNKTLREQSKRSMSSFKKTKKISINQRQKCLTQIQRRQKKRKFFLRDLMREKESLK